jgi:hypothetical protein
VTTKRTVSKNEFFSIVSATDCRTIQIPEQGIIRDNNGKDFNNLLPVVISCFLVFFPNMGAKLVQKISENLVLVNRGRSQGRPFSVPET